MKDIIVLGLKLLLICLISAALLGVTNELTKDKIAEVQAAASEQARKDVAPDAERFEAVDAEKMAEIVAVTDKVQEAFVAYKGDEVIGFVLKTAPSGYGGPVVVITGIDASGVITGVRVGTHTETPGLGANATLPSFYEQYDGKSVVTGVGVSKTGSSDTEIQAISGATITSAAVTNGVNFAGDILDILTK